MTKPNVTKQTIAALKHCTYFGFRLQGRGTIIEAVKRVSNKDKEKNPFAQDVIYTHEIETKISDYSPSDDPVLKSGPHKPERKYKGWASEDNYEFSPNPAQLLSSLLKEGDCLVAHWIMGNSQWAQKKGFNHDQLKLEIYRFDKRTKDWKTVGGFCFADEITDNETAIVRMIKVA